VHARRDGDDAPRVDLALRRAEVAHPQHLARVARERLREHLAPHVPRALRVRLDGVQVAALVRVRVRVAHREVDQVVLALG